MAQYKHDMLKQTGHFVCDIYPLGMHHEQTKVCLQKKALAVYMYPLISTEMEDVACAEDGNSLKKKEKKNIILNLYVL